ncbi:MAG: type IV secretion system protein VirB3 [Alphaproteobacteria bacterium CG11_big_fil_rev_8_21_14_0_20_44_7]|nr:MAG: type IV secretion system protein VirB3 [Alphaproteobacteria bacterium CG11_big_fil_rev_8_21_14_0_20_44_7]
MAKEGNLQADPLFLGLTRPAQIAGVHYLLFLVNFMGNILLFINHVFENRMLAVVVGFGSVHIIFYLICLKEPRMIELFLKRYGKCMKCRNRFFHKGTNSYDLT